MRNKIIENKRPDGELYEFPSGLVVAITSTSMSPHGLLGAGVVVKGRDNGFSWQEEGYHSESWSIYNARKL